MCNQRDMIRATYPELLNLNQIRTILKISKRKAAWMLQNNYIQCKCTGKQTRQYEIRIEALFDYMDKVECNDPEAKIPVGIFSSKPSKKSTRKRRIPRYCVYGPLPESFKKWLTIEWSEVSDKLTIKGVSRITGYATSTIQKWTAANKLKCVFLENEKIIIAKDWLIDFYYDEGQWIKNKCNKHIKLMNKYYCESDLEKAHGTFVSMRF